MLTVARRLLGDGRVKAREIGRLGIPREVVRRRRDVGDAVWGRLAFQPGGLFMVVRDALRSL
jgi:hypothetical protein